MRVDRRSGCPINLTLEVLGDKWSLLVIRDMIFGNRRHFRELLRKSEEGIASNTLASRLQELLECGIITNADDPTHKQKTIYSLTERGIELLPVLAQMAGWGRKYLPVTEELGVRARLLEEGGPKMWEQFMSELRVEHLGVPARRKAKSSSPSVLATLQAAYEAVLVRNRETAQQQIKPATSGPARSARRLARKPIGEIGSVGARAVPASLREEK